MPQFYQKKTSAIIAAAIVVLSAGISGCNKTQTTEGLLAEAKQYQQKGDMKAAIIQLKNALQKDPENKDVRFQLGVIYNEAGDAVSAEKEIRKAISLGYDGKGTTSALSKALLGQGQFQKVLDEIQKILATKSILI